ncbi:MAG: DUF4173 domain-containing protein [Oscillospiraceae bacterium]|nr:DUF4173 domain-containing protein [Oscillospiraceae bacterium]
MEENKQPQYFSPVPPAVPKKPETFPAGKQEIVLGFLILICSWFFFNSIYFGGFNIGAAVGLGGIILISTAYLLLKGHRLTIYTGTLLALDLVICGSFARSDDSFVKFIMVCFLIVSVNLGLCLLAGQNHRCPGGFSSVLDIPRTVFMLGVAKLDPSVRGLFQSLRSSGSAGKKGGAVLLGLVIAFPLLLILIPLLTSADAAFDALLSKLPEIDLEEILVTLIFGTLLAVFFFVRATALQHAKKEDPAPQRRKGISAITVNTVLVAIAVVYGVYLVSQLAYFSGGFSGILPEDFTVAQYARRGFFEMAWLCAINLAIIALSVGLVRGDAPKATRLICLFIGIVTVFLAVSASAKMFLYIGSFGLTRLRVLTQVIIFWLGLTTVLVCIWLFAPKLSYMKIALILALAMGAAVAWADVDTVVARYNVKAYQTGKLETVDVEYLDSLGHGAVPYIAQLQADPDPEVANAAKWAMSRGYYINEDLRAWNYVNQIAKPYYDD